MNRTAPRATRKRLTLSLAVTLLTLALVTGCAPAEPTVAATAEVEWAIAIHGGAGALPPDTDEARVAEIEASLERALTEGRRILDEGGTALDAVEQVIRLMEDDPIFNAGRGAVFNAVAEHELDASIMDGSDLSCGAVAGVRTVKNPITLARRVMTETRHVLLAGEGAEAFADQEGVVRVSNDYFSTPRRRDALQRVLDRQAAEADGQSKGTVGVAARDRHGDIAAGTSTGGMTAKRFGRVGDSPIVGAGTYADNRTCGVSGTGIGEEYIRHGVARTISALVEYQGWDLRRAVDHVMQDKLKPGDGGVIAVGADGTIVFGFNTASMLRGSADSTGRFSVAIWPDGK